MYDRQILQILYEVGGKGIAVRKLAKHVYNLNCTLFSQPDLCQIHTFVQQYLQRNSKSGNALVERCERRGYYRLNARGISTARQILPDSQNRAAEETDEQQDEKPQRDLSLSLFD